MLALRRHRGDFKSFSALVFMFPDENAVMVSTYLPEENAWYYKTISVIGGETN